jgi:hypothetical protein
VRVSPLAFCVILSIASSLPAAEPFRAGSASTYAHQSAEKVTVGAKSFDKPDLVEQAFGKKLDLLKYGIVPVLVVIENNGKEAIDLQNIEVNLVAADGRRATAVSPQELMHLNGPTKRPGLSKTPIPLPKKRNPLESPEIVARSFVARIVPPGDNASGFFYFEAEPEKGDKLYLSGMRHARSGQEILYFEFALEQ